MDGDTTGGTCEPPAEESSPSAGEDDTTDDTAAGADSGSGLPRSEANDGAIELDELCDTYVDALCAYYSTCQRTRFRDREQCRQELDCYGAAAFIQAAEAGGVRYDPEEAAARFDDYFDDPCSTIYFPSAFEAYRPTLFEFLQQWPSVFVSLRKEGDECLADEECPLRYFCDDSTCPGRCTPLAGVDLPCRENDSCYNPQVCLEGVCHLLARAGESCASDLDCREDLVCNSGLCEVPARPGVGEPCMRDFNGAKPAVLCADELFCDGAAHEPGTCRRRGATDDPCASDQECGAGLNCVTDSALGERRCLPPSPVDGPCNDSGDCGSELRCDPNGCQPYAVLGQACDILRDCVRDLTCRAGSCVTAQYVGALCDVANSGCVRSECQDGVCVAPAKLGQSCSSHAACQSYRCLDGRCADRDVCLEP